MFIFRKKTKTSLGIDIGTSAVKLVELEKKEERYSLKSYGVFSMNEYLSRPKGQFTQKTPELLDRQMADMIKETVREAGIQAKKAHLSVPVYSSFSTLIDLPAMPEKEINAAIPFEAKKYIPIPIADVILDWSIISGQPSESANVQVLVVAVPKDFLSKHVKIVKLAGLELQAIEAETFSLTRSLIGNDKSAVLLVDTGARSSNISIVDDGYVRVTRNLEMGGAEFTKEIGQRMNIELDKAEQIKKTDRGVKEISQLVLDIIIAEVRKIINHYQDKYGRKIEKCVLVGGGSSLPGFVDYFVSKLGIEISSGNPFSRVAYPPILESAVKELGPSLAVAVGLAMRGS